MAVIEAVRADITTQDLDAIVNAANSQLAHGGGVAAAIARAAGPELVADSAAHAEVPTGRAGHTTAGNLPCRNVIHAVGPVWRGGREGEDALLAGAYRSSVELAAGLDCHSIAFPSISTGIYGFPLDRAAPIAVTAVRGALADHPDVELVRFCLFSDRDLEAYTRALES